MTALYDINVKMFLPQHSKDSLQETEFLFLRVQSKSTAKISPAFNDSFAVLEERIFLEFLKPKLFLVKTSLIKQANV